MTRFSYKINRTISGIKEENHYRNRMTPLNSSDDLRDINLDDEDLFAIKTLKDKIKLLEIELQKAREQSFQAGYEEGRDSTLQEANRKIEAVVKKMQEAENSFFEAVDKLETPVLKLAKKMARVVLATELKIRDDHDAILISKLRDMLYELVDQHKVIIRLNPEQLSKFKNRNLNDEMDLPKKMEISQIADDNLENGEAVIQTEEFFVDGTYSSQLDQVEDQLKDENK